MNTELRETLAKQIESGLLEQVRQDLEQALADTPRATDLLPEDPAWPPDADPMAVAAILMLAKQVEAARTVLLGVLPGMEMAEVEAAWVLGSLRCFVLREGQRVPSGQWPEPLTALAAGSLCRTHLADPAFGAWAGGPLAKERGWAVERSRKGHYELLRPAAEGGTLFLTQAAGQEDWDLRVCGATELLPAALLERRAHQIWGVDGLQAPSPELAAWFLKAAAESTGTADPGRFEAARGLCLEQTGALGDALAAYGGAQGHNADLLGLMRAWARVYLRSQGPPIPLPVEDLAAIVEELGEEKRQALSFAPLAEGVGKAAWRTLLRELGPLATEPELRSSLADRAISSTPEDEEVVERVLALDALEGKPWSGLLAHLELILLKKPSAAPWLAARISTALPWKNGAEEIASSVQSTHPALATALERVGKELAEVDQLVQKGLDAVSEGDWKVAARVSSKVRKRHSGSISTAKLEDAIRERMNEYVRAIQKVAMAMQGGRNDEEGWRQLEACGADGLLARVAGVLDRRSENRDQHPGLALWAARCRLRARSYERARVLFVRSAEGQRGPNGARDLLVEFLEYVGESEDRKQAVAQLEHLGATGMPDGLLGAVVDAMLDKGVWGRPEAEDILKALAKSGRALGRLRSRLEPMKAVAPWQAALAGLKLD